METSEGKQSFVDSAVPAGFLRRNDFGPDFLFGSSTSSFQIEGAYKRDGRTPSIYDTLAKKQNLFEPYGEDAVNHRKHYKEDVKLMKEIGFNAYRFSISWTRVMPNGKRSEEGINFYKDLLRNLKDAGIVAMATLVHFDPPQDLEDQYYTFLSPKIVDDFCAYAELCFLEFGEYVKYWVTVNEPWFVAYGGYIDGVIPPGLKSGKDYDAIRKALAATTAARSVQRDIWASVVDNIDDNSSSSICPPHRYSPFMKLKLKSKWSFNDVAVGNNYESSRMVTRSIPASQDDVALPPPEKRPYLAGHYQILAHAKAAKLYKNKYQQIQGGKIGLNLVAQWFIPMDDTQENIDAAQRATDFMFGWFMDPLYKGDYPEVMRKFVTKGHLPCFSSEEKKMVQGSYDFVSLNYYTARYVTNFANSPGGDFVLDQRINFDPKKNDVPIGPVQGAAGWVYGYPKGLLELLLYIKKNYGDPEICITENGIDDFDDGSMTHWDSFHDQKRILFLHDHLAYVKEAIRKGVKVSGHFVWSFMDNVELLVGFNSRFGITYVDYDDPKSKRIPKLSASWYKYFLNGKETSPPADLGPIYKHIETVESKLHVAVAQNSSQISDLKSGSSTKQDISDLNGKIKALEQSIQVLKGPTSPPVDLGPIYKLINSIESKLANQDCQIRDLNSQIGALTTKVNALPSALQIDFNSSKNRVNIGKIMVSSCRVPVVQDAIGKGLLRWASAEGSRLWDLVHWQSLLDSSKHKYYGGGFNLQAAIIGHPTKHGVNVSIPTWVEDMEFSKCRNSEANNEVTWI